MKLQMHHCCHLTMLMIVLTLLRSSKSSENVRCGNELQLFRRIICESIRTVSEDSELSKFDFNSYKCSPFLRSVIQNKQIWTFLTVRSIPQASKIIKKYD